MRRERACAACHGNGEIEVNPSYRGDPQCAVPVRCDDCGGSGLSPLAAEGLAAEAVAYDEWLLDRFEFTEEHADIDEVRALNALLELPLRTGFELDPFD